jgi:hypothetical protein
MLDLLVAHSAHDLAQAEHVDAAELGHPSRHLA